jgi:hypothetical protein
MNAAGTASPGQASGITVALPDSARRLENPAMAEDRIL